MERKVADAIMAACPSIIATDAIFPVTEIAAAAIKAMREPTDDMIAASRAAAHHRAANDDLLRDIHRAHIDAASPP